jgi:dihydrofolate reductase
MPVRVSIIVAASRNGVIGAAGGIPWHLSTDLRRFKRLTMGHSMIMGRLTFQSLGRPLPGRRHIVLTSDPAYLASGVDLADSWQSAMALVAGEEEVFVIGGGTVYQFALPHAHRIYLTLVEADVTGDVHLNLESLHDWILIDEQYVPADANDQFAHRFRVLDRPNGLQVT